MKKSTKKIVSAALSAMMLMGCVSTGLSVNAAGGTLCSKYATNPDGKVGTQKTITVDGDASDWSEDMLIAQGAAWDVANHYKGGHENCVLDTYSLYATWDNDNLYVGWQMVNTTDTWAREGDGPLSDGGRVLDVPLILALSVDPNSTSMSNKNTSGNPIWGQKMGLEFNQHVDHLFYMSGKPGLGTPAMFTAVDKDGNTNYTDGCHTFASSGIEYKMATTNICSSIWGLNYSEDTSDIYNEDADWVDYKTFKGSSGTHNTKYDSFYEMKIPFSALGIDKSYLESTGIGAMLVATRGESGLDCIPYDDTMLDNALGSYGNDPSTSAEKDDVDVITSEFARIGKLKGDQPTTTKPTVPTQPTTIAQPTTSVQPTTQPSPTQPSSKLSVTATSNLFPKKTVVADSTAKTVTVSCDLQSAMKLVNGYFEIKYDPSVLRFDPEKNTDILPYILDEISNTEDGIIRTSFSNVMNLYDFTTKKTFLNLKFDVVTTGETTVDIYADELSVGYISNGVLNFENAYIGGSSVDLSGVAGYEKSKITGSTTVSTDQVTTVAPTTVTPTTVAPTTVAPTTAAENLTVNAKSNYFGSNAKVVDKSQNQVTVYYNLTSTMGVVDSQWKLSYDSSKLKYVSSSMPNASNVMIYNNGNVLNGSFASVVEPVKYNNSTFLSVTFDVIGRGSTDVNLNVEYLSVGYTSGGKLSSEYVVDESKIIDVTGKTGFENVNLKRSTSFVDSSVMLGDVDLNGKITIVDVTLTQKHVVNLVTLSDKQLIAADVDKDNTISIKDATLILRYVVGLADSLG